MQKECLGVAKPACKQLNILMMKKVRRGPCDAMPGLDPDDL